MNATREIREKAELFGWAVHAAPVGDLYIRGEQSVLVDFAKDGSVRRGELYEFFSIADMHLRKRALEKNKKAAIISWLAA